MRARSTWSRRWIVQFLVLLVALFGVRAAKAQILQPDGLAIPNIVDSFEMDLREYFAMEGEAIDPIAEASIEPAVFSPLCNFEAALVLNESQGVAGLAWYNVPADATSTPTEVFEIVPVTAMVGQVFTSADIRSHPGYLGGPIGFVLVNGATRIYYSEYQRNYRCTSCIAPGSWKMMLTYRSQVHQSAYYLAFEDWGGATENNPNDNDFNDKVFLVSGVSCPDGGVPCETGKLGFCSSGLTDCQIGGGVVCKQEFPERPETCDQVDNDCNGLVDDGDLCEDNLVCVRGQCVAPCSGGEFRCPFGQECDSAGHCVEPACRDVVCDPGKVCRAGACVEACSGVVCPVGHVCQLGVCIDPCANVECEAGNVCDRGVCVGDCSCRGCPAGLSCGRDGRCVEPGCAMLSCQEPERCAQSACVDACRDASCPFGAACTNGSCEAPQSVGAGGQTIGVGGALVIDPISPNPTAGANSTGGGGRASGGNGSSAPPTHGRAAPEKGCACGLRTPNSPPWLAAASLAVSALLLRRRRRTTHGLRPQECKTCM